MKRIFYHMACWLAVLGCAACSNEADFVKTEADNNSIVLDISSATTPVTRAGATGAEVTVSYVDVLIFDDTDNKSLAHYERVQVVADIHDLNTVTDAALVLLVTSLELCGTLQDLLVPERSRPFPTEYFIMRGKR